MSYRHVNYLNESDSDRFLYSLFMWLSISYVLQHPLLMWACFWMCRVRKLTSIPIYLNSAADIRSRDVPSESVSWSSKWSWKCSRNDNGAISTSSLCLVSWSELRTVERWTLFPTRYVLGLITLSRSERVSLPTTFITFLSIIDLIPQTCSWSIGRYTEGQNTFRDRHTSSGARNGTVTRVPHIPSWVHDYGCRTVRPPER